jgi:GPH family glycoside/pentoside/hexuronide:cation symporter
VTQPTPLPPLRRLLFALGNPGFQITDRIVVTMVVYFYLPPPDRGLEPLVPEHAWLGVLTIFGLAMLVGRVFDTLADPVVGHASDRSRSPWGRRRAFLIYGVAPMVAIPVLLFFPPGAPGSMQNALWLVVLLSLYFVVFTVYVGPYLALIPELAWGQAERVRLVQWMSIVSIPVMGVLSAWGLGLDAGRALGLTAADSMRWLVVLLSLAALALCLCPIVAIDEPRHVRGERADLDFGDALWTTLRNRPFLIYLVAQIFFVIGINLVQPLLPYLATVALGRSEGFTVWFTLAMGVGVAVGFGLQRALVERFRPKRVMMGCIAVMAVSVGLLGGLEPDAAGGPHDAWNLAVCFTSLVLFGVPAAGFLVLPQVLISQLIDRDERQQGASRSAMFFGVQGLLTKWSYGLSTWILTLLLARLGNSPEEPWGVVWVGPVAAVCAVVSLALYAFYPESSVLAADEGGEGAA